MPDVTPNRGYTYPLPPDPNDLSFIMQVPLEQIDADVHEIFERLDADQSWMGEAAIPTVAGSGIVNVVVAFPPGRFTVPPLVNISTRGSSWLIATQGPTTTLSMTCTVRNLGTASVSGGTLVTYARVPG